MLYIRSSKRSFRFLFACLLYQLHTKRIKKREHVWVLHADSPEAHYLNLLFGKNLDTQFVYSLTRSCRFIDYGELKRSVFYEATSICNEHRGYILEFTPELYQADEFSFDVIDELLNWPRDLSKIFFDFIYSQPRAKTIQELAAKLGLGNPKELIRLNGARQDLPRKPTVCPFCGSKNIINISQKWLLCERDFIYESPDPLPSWHCQHCGLSIWRNIYPLVKDWEIPKSVKKLLSPKDNRYQIVYLGEYGDYHVYYDAPLRYVGCVGFPVFVLEKDGIARWADVDKELPALMYKFSSKF